MNQKLQETIELLIEKQDSERTGGIQCPYCTDEPTFFI